MKKIITRLIIVGLLVGLMAGAPPVSQAAETQPTAETTAKKSKAESAKKKTKSDVAPIRGKISAVDTVDRTITLGGKEKSRVIHVKSDTKLTKDGQPVTFDAAVVGEEVGGRVRKVGDDRYEAVSLRLGAKPEAKPKSKAASPNEMPGQTR